MSETYNPLGIGVPIPERTEATHPIMPPEIATAILDVMGNVKALEKDAATTGGSRFRYTSVDQFFELLGPLMAKAGIFTVLHEVGATISEKSSTDDRGGSRTSNWMTTDYELWLYHKTGVAYGPVKRKIQVIASGPQSYGMGPSYVEKYFLRSLFKVPTGEEDADAHPKTGLPTSRDERQPAKSESNADLVARESKAYVLAYIESSKKKWEDIKSQEGMAAWWKENLSLQGVYFKGKDDPLYADFKTAFTERGKALPEKNPVGSTTITSGAGAGVDKPQDDVPGFNGEGRPSESSIRMNVKTALVRCADPDAVNEVLIKYVEPYEASLPKPFVDEIYNLAMARRAVLET